ncbi:MAG: sodium:solute symporter family protein [Ignavibacteria bacterium]|jgi:SSS family solute:Na+ symporter|nr:MAG: sodium:solute symporter family protein [Chlorobiota bacterium]KXK04640.1 MAG: Na+/proline symporter [Chlorobi bacterium OLB4]MBV6399496.1 hypothetical protein [Ignavibacteria bacterium]MCC6886660.1 sodium:solute symporter family protein [Ignavibacteriales bacterium]MCE7953201.1 sodium:solute symporter family protein [Chlorobi bacterium CHB7]OQY76552.1 MAG: hypothetical protein B6D43_10255 [Ignavibacteriales bacterium UTCHB1]RIK50069.1 MAG: hypothetical protein DCC60_01500 [Ignavibacte
MINFRFEDILIILLYFVAVLYIGLRTKRSDSSVSEFIVAGRTLTLPAFVATLVSTFYGGILGVGEFTYTAGLSSWFMNAFPYYFFTGIFAFFLAGKIRKTNLYTIPDKLRLSYGKKASMTGAFLIFLLVTPAPYIFMLAVIFQLIFDINIYLSVVIVLAISVIYLFRGGLLADVRLNIFEFILMFASFGIMLPFCYFTFGGWEFLKQNLPHEHITPTGGLSFQYMFVWFFIGAWALVDPTFHQRCYAAKSESTARYGVFISLIFWFIFDFLTTGTGLYAKAFLKDLENPVMSYPLLADAVLPPLLKGFFFVGLMATVMSTLHSYIFVSGTTLGRDILGRLSGKSDSNSFSKTGILVSSILSILIIILIPSVVEIWYTIGSLVIPALLISVLSAYTNKFRTSDFTITIAMISSVVISFIFFCYGQINSTGGNPVYPFGIEPMYPGLLTGIIIFIVGLYFRKVNAI